MSLKSVVSRQTIDQFDYHNHWSLTIILHMSCKISNKFYIKMEINGNFRFTNKTANFLKAIEPMN